MTKHHSLLRALAMSAALGLGGAAAAEPISVEYFVHQKAFKSGVNGTDVLDFRLYEDADCSVEIGSYPIFANDEYAHFYIDKNQRIRGGKKLPKAIRIRAMIDAPMTASAPYLQISGPGIVPVGEACQLQGVSPIAALGPQGDTGPAGVDGAVGPQGPQGETGAAGPAGADGATGTDGAQGADGATGADGAQGATGPAGSDGATGETGLAGADGADGATGAQGETGPAGPAGADGATGADGAQGATGPAGADGATGAQGETGPAGPAGADGATGADGAQGAAGADGATGAQGETGPAGADGATGPQGETGPAGPAETSGSLLGGNYSNTADGNFLSPFNPSAGSEDNTNLPVPSGTAGKLIVNVGLALGAGNNVTITLRKNGVDTGLSCTVAAGESSCFDLVDSVSFSDGDLMSVRYNEGGSPNSRPRFTIVYQAP